jgi:predicted alpha/beta superfamily hydrolase
MAVKASGARSPSRVVKVPGFTGSLSTRDIYVYLPPGYDDGHAFYPVIYMHDGQNVFEQYATDSFAGSWHGEVVADKLIRQKKMQPCIIIGISNGKEKRLAEYLPPYASFRFSPPGQQGSAYPIIIKGEADKTFDYYQKEVVPFIKSHYRVREGRNDTATCGSSMGGLFSTYLAWEHPDFARHHAALSPAYWATNDGQGKLETIERIKRLPKRDIRLWLDSGEGRNIPGRDDDNKFVTLEAREALLEADYIPKQDFRYHLARGAKHHESYWHARLDKVFRFLFPYTP